MRKLLCVLGLHSWDRLADRLECYGMGTEWFQYFRCADCSRLASQFRDNPRMWRVWPKEET